MPWLSSLGGNDYTTQLRSAFLCVTDLLEKHGSCQLSLAALLACHQSLQPRYYSACSAPNGQAKSVSFAFNMVDSVLPDEQTKDW